MWGHAQKIRSFVIVPAYFLNNSWGGVCIIKKFGHFKGKQWMEYWQKILLDNLPGGRTQKIIKNTKYCGATN